MSDAPFDLVDAKDSFTDTDWFHACRNTQTPYVVVRSGETSADVLWDYVTLPARCDAAIQADFAALEHAARDIFARFAIPDSYLRVKPTLICFDRLPFDQAKRAASELYSLIAAYLPASASPSAQAIPALPQDARVHNIHRDPRPSGRRLWVEESDRATSAA